MKVGLINPPQAYSPDKNVGVKYVFLNGISYVEAALRKAGYEVVTVNFAHDNQARLEDVADCDVVGIGSTIDSYKFLKNSLPKLEQQGKFIMVGGTLISSYGLSPNNVLMKAFPEITAGVIGEAEDTVLDIMDYYSDKLGARFPESGMVFRRDHHGELEATEYPGIAPGNFDDLPEIDYSRWKGFKEAVEGNLVTLNLSRGCPGSCSFCYRMTGKTPRSFYAERADKEIKKVLSLNPKEVEFFDETFSYDKSRAIQIAEIARLNGLKDYAVETRVDCVDENLLRNLKERGCKTVRYGIESFDNDVLKKAGKGITSLQSYEAIRLARKAGLEPFGFFIFGLPGETRQSLEKTLKGIEETKIYPRTRLAMPYPGTRIYREALRQGKIRDEVELLRQFSEEGCQDTTEGNWVPVNLTEDVSDEELIEARDRANALRNKFEREQGVRAG